MTAIRRVLAGGTAAAIASLTVTATPAQAAPQGWATKAMGVDAAQRLTRGHGVTVAVIDSGVVDTLPELRGKVTTGPDYRQDGLHKGMPRWGVHGTGMASNVLKVAPKAHILSIRAIDDKEHHHKYVSGPRTSLSKAIRYATDHGAQVISMSLGSGDNKYDKYQAYEANAVGYAISHGITLVASSGNEGGVGQDAILHQNDASFPAGYPGVIAVAATRQGGGRASFSDVHAYNAVAAPGVGIYSLKPTGGYSIGQGTSQAGALTAGVVALMRARNPKITPAQVRAILTRTAHHPSGGHNALVGYGQIDAAAAVKAAASPPDVKIGPVAYKGKKTLGEPGGPPRTTTPPMNMSMLGTGLAGVVAGLLLISGAALLLHGGRRRAEAQASSGGPGGAMPPQPPHTPPAR